MAASFIINGRDIALAWSADGRLTIAVDDLAFLMRLLTSREWQFGRGVPAAPGQPRHVVGFSQQGGGAARP